MGCYRMKWSWTQEGLGVIGFLALGLNSARECRTNTSQHSAQREILCMLSISSSHLHVNREIFTENAAHLQWELDEDSTCLQS